MIGWLINLAFVHVLIGANVWALMLATGQVDKTLAARRARGIDDSNISPVTMTIVVIVTWPKAVRPFVRHLRKARAHRPAR